MQDLSDRTQLVGYLKEHGLWLNKGLGQHFLIDNTVLQKTIEAADLSEDATVLEIGPGVGTLTQELAKAVPSGLVLAIERDHKLVELLRDRFKNTANVKVIHEDFLRYSLAEIGKSYIVVANLPYQITGAILRKFMDPDNAYKPEKMVMMMQKEVAERLVAQPKYSDRGIVTVLRELFGPAEIVTMIEPFSFFPPPQVDSAVIMITNQPPVKDPELAQGVLALARAGFSAKRRTLANALAASWRISKNIIEDRLREIGLNPLARAEELSLQDWLKLVSRLKPQNGGKKI